MNRPPSLALHLKYRHTATPQLTSITDGDGEATQSSGIERLSSGVLKTNVSNTNEQSHKHNVMLWWIPKAQARANTLTHKHAQLNSRVMYVVRIGSLKC